VTVAEVEPALQCFALPSGERPPVAAPDAAGASTGNSLLLASDGEASQAVRFGKTAFPSRLDFTVNAAVAVGRQRSLAWPA